MMPAKKRKPRADDIEMVPIPVSLELLKELAGQWSTGVQIRATQVEGRWELEIRDCVYDTVIR